MPIGPDGRIIRRRVRQMTPVSTNNPSPHINFFVGYISAMIVTIIVLILFGLTGWLGGLLVGLSWWNGTNFVVAGFVLNLILFPAYVSGVLEGLANTRRGKFKLYAFLYGFISIALLIILTHLDGNSYNNWNFLWAVGYGFYTLGLANRIAR